MVLVYFNGGGSRKVKKFRFLENFAENPYCLGKVIAVGNALVYGKAKLDGIPELIDAVFIEEGNLFYLADRSEERHRTTVEKMVVVGVHLDGAKICKVCAGVCRVINGKGFGINAVILHFPESPG